LKGNRLTPSILGAPKRVRLLSEMVEINSRIMIDPEQCGDGRPMKPIKLVGDIDDRHRLLAEVPKELPVGPVRLIVLLPEEDDAGALWAAGMGHEWSAELRDRSQDIYTLEDGQPVSWVRPISQ